MLYLCLRGSLLSRSYIHFVFSLGQRLYTHKAQKGTVLNVTEPSKYISEISWLALRVPLRELRLTIMYLLLFAVVVI